LAQSEVGVGDDQLHPAKPTGLQRPQKRRPERAILGITDGEAEHLAAAIAAHPGGDHHRLGDHAAVDSRFAVGGVHEHIGEGLPGQRPVPEGRHLAVQVGADPRDF
jgi:hypothetical protein